MKTHKNLYPQVWAFDNLLAAAKKAQRGKRREPDVYAFNAELERNLLELQAELRDRTWQPGVYRDFYVYEPKKRLVSAAPYRDRVVHHALCRVLEPVWERMFIFDSYACRVGKGTHKAADRYTEFSRKAAYVLKCDIRKYFEHVDHAILLGEIGRYVPDGGVLWLVKTILNSNDARPAAKPGRGIPIGNLTSQFFANVYLNRFDHWVKEELQARFYIRYVDDFVLLADDKTVLHAWLAAIEEKLAERGLTVHPAKRNVFPVSEGCDFMGYRIWPSHRRLRPKTGYHGRRKLRRLARRYAGGEVSLARVRSSVAAWLGHVKHADTRGLRRAVLGGVPFARSPRPSGVMFRDFEFRHAEGRGGPEIPKQRGSAFPSVFRASAIQDSGVGHGYIGIAETQKGMTALNSGFSVSTGFIRSALLDGGPGHGCRRVPG